MSAVTVLAPAKINLGLEILGKRPDGYHEIRTILAAIQLHDRITVEVAPPGDKSVHVDGVPGVSDEDNLIYKAVRAFSSASRIGSGYRIEVEKHIPSPGGLGGASSNAAATLLALSRLHNEPLDQSDLNRLAASLGADVPFFLGSPVALASGTGTTLQPLPDVEGHLVLIVPPLLLEGKTVRLYGALRPADFSTGEAVARIAGGIRRGALAYSNYFVNAFERPLHALAPGIATVVKTIREVVTPAVSLSGAGPSYYVVLPTAEEAVLLAEQLRPELPADVRLYVTRLGRP